MNKEKSKESVEFEEWKVLQKEKLNKCKGKTIKDITVETHGETDAWYEVLVITFTDGTKLTFSTNEPDIDYMTTLDWTLELDEKQINPKNLDHYEFKHRG